MRWDSGAIWKVDWPRTDFLRSSVDFKEIISGGPGRGGIPAVDDQVFESVDAVEDLEPTEPVIALAVNGVAKAYPLRILMWHEIANDVIADIPITVTYCPLCNAAIVFDSRVGREDSGLRRYGASSVIRT